ncbi:MAG: hypothetical protein K6C96_11905, partial [Butyrivibrio sp.]|nr:hypothetical protein [Butyrivibrio sp.]
SKFIYIKDKNGTLATGLTTIGGKKYAFSEEGELMLPSGISHMISFLFYCNRTGSPTDEKDAKNFYIVTGKIQKLPDSSEYVVIGKDGTRYSGMYSEGGKKYCISLGMFGIAKNTYVVSGGKAYYIGNEGFAVGGWYKCTTGQDVDSYKNIDFGEEGQYFYFDPKTLNPVSGWKTVIAPATDGNGNILCDENVVRTNNTSKKLYFNVNDVQGLQKGALVRNTDITIKGKLYRLGADGSIKTGTEGKTFADESSVAKDAYVKKDGTLATGRTAVKINGQTGYYYYSPRTHKMEKNVLRKTGSKWYYYGKNGKQTTGTLLADAIHSNYKAVAVFSKDGSISGFIYETLGGKVKNEVISLDPSGDEESDFYVLGTNALPVTGLYSVPDYLQTTFGGCRKLNIYSDGYLEYVEGSAGIMKMEKIGQKYYLTKNGAILVNPNDSYRLDEIDYSSLPVSDRDEIARLVELSKGTLNNTITVMPNKDGSIGMRALNWTAYGYTVYTNRYGFAYDSIAPFYKKGSTWYMSIDAAFFACMVGNSYFDFEMEDTEGENAVIRMHFDKTFKITSITYVEDGIDTGVAANGIYIIEGADPDGDGEESAPYYLVNFNKGKLATGKKSVSVYFGIISFSVNFDSEFGVAKYPNMGS